MAIRFFYFANQNEYNSFFSNGVNTINPDYLYVIEQEGLLYKGNKLIAQSGTQLFNSVTEAIIAVNDVVKDNTSRIVAVEGSISGLDARFNSKVDKIEGKGLSEANFTQVEKTKLAGIAEGANAITIDSALSNSSTNPVQNKIVKSELDKKVPTNRTINEQPLSSNITLTHESVGADKAGTASSAVSTHNLDTTAHNDIRTSIGNNTSEISKVSGNLTAHIDNAGVHLNDDLKAKITNAYTYSTQNHATKAFTKIKIGNTTIETDSNAGTLTLVAGDGVTITPDTSKNTVTINSLDGVREIKTGSSNGTIKVDGTDVAVKGLKSAAYQDSSDILSAAEGKTNELISNHKGDGTHVTSDQKTAWTNAITQISQHEGTTDIHVGDGEKDKWNGAYNHSTSTHAPTDARANIIETIKVNNTALTPSNKTVNITVPTQASDINAAPSNHSHDNYINQVSFGKIKVANTSIEANTTIDTIEFEAGTGISISPDVTNDKITITNSGVTSVTTGSGDGKISVNGADVAVKGLKSAAYTASTAYDAAGTAETKANAALASAKSYTDEQVAFLLDNSTDAVDSIKELAEAMAANDNNVVTSLTEAIGKKADKSHTHAISDVTSLQSSLNGKVSTATTVNGKALSGNITLSASDVGAYAKTETYSSGEIDNKLNEKVNTVNGKGLSTNDFTTTLKDKLNNINVKSVAFTPELTSGVKVGTITIDGNSQDLYCQKNTNTHYTAKNIIGDSDTQQSNVDNLTNGNVYLNLVENSKVNSSNKISGSGYTSVTATGGNITVTTEIPTASSSTLGLMSKDMATKVEGLKNVANIVYASGGTLPQATGGSAGIVYSESSEITDFSVCPINGGKVYYKDTNTTYSAGSGISINSSNQIANTGIVTLTTGSANGTVSANGTNVAVKGLGSAAYTESTAYAPAGKYAGASEQGGKANSAATADYATSAGSATTAASATTASKLSVSAGNSSTPVYFEEGIPKECSSVDTKVTQTNITGTDSYPLLVANADSTNTQTAGVKKVSNAKLTGTGALQVTSITIGDATLKYEGDALVISFS